MVDGRLKRIPQPWLWALAGAALVGVFVFVFAAAPSLLIGPPPKGLSAADELKALNDVRTTLVQALAGLAVAGGLIVTYRTYQQGRVEQDRTYERELYAKAVEQLGHEKAPVRLGALYSLERLAQDKPERRPVIVDVICAYLRMPFSPTAPREPDGKVARNLAERTETEARINEIGNTWWQERQVRLTAQRILVEHLRDDRTKAQRLTDPPSTHFWPDIRLDLSGATLIDFILHNPAMAAASFDRAIFSGWAGFEEATFSDYASFRWATFSGSARFDKATFSGPAWFQWAIFSDYAGFDGATFNDWAEFDEATFSKRAWFHGATFNTRRDRPGDRRARFDGATFSGDAGFDDAIFSDGARFDGATFSGPAWFDGATFSGGVDSLSFDQSRILSPDDAGGDRLGDLLGPTVWPTGWCRVPDGKGGYTVARTNDASRS